MLVNRSVEIGPELVGGAPELFVELAEVGLGIIFGPVHELILKLSGSVDVKNPKDLRKQNVGRAIANSKTSGKTANRIDADNAGNVPFVRFCGSVDAGGATESKGEGSGRMREGPRLSEDRIDD